MSDKNICNPTLHYFLSPVTLYDNSTFKKPFHPLFPLFPCQLINRAYAKFKTAIFPLPYRLSRPFHPGSFP